MLSLNFPICKMVVTVVVKEPTPFMPAPMIPLPLLPSLEGNKEVLVSQTEVCIVLWATFCGLHFSRGQGAALDDEGQRCELCNPLCSGAGASGLIPLLAMM